MSNAEINQFVSKTSRSFAIKRMIVSKELLKNMVIINVKITLCIPYFK